MKITQVSKFILINAVCFSLTGCIESPRTPISSPTPPSLAIPTETKAATLAPTLTIMPSATPTQGMIEAKITPTDVVHLLPAGDILFDDFTYHDQTSLLDHGWIIRDKTGWPGVPGASWPKENFSFIDDPDQPDNRLLQMLASTDGSVDRTQQAQLCHQRKYLEGTYAARVYFTDEPVSGPDGDKVVETFYMISPLVVPLDPDYSEMDSEYLPNGGWSYTDHDFAFTTWETAQIEPWIADNDTVTIRGVAAGWHTIVIQVNHGRVYYLLDGVVVAMHTGKYYPEVPMSINFNLWFVNAGLINSSETRQYIERVDWVYFEAKKTVTPPDVNERVNSFRQAGVPYHDTVPDWDPPLESPCDM